MEPTGTLQTALAHANRLLDLQPALAAEQATEILRVVPDHPPTLFLLAVALGRTRRGDEAIAVLRKLVERNPDHPEAWRVLADHLMAVGDTAGADEAYSRHIHNSARNPALLQPAAAMLKNEIPRAEALLKAHLKKAPTDVPAIRMLAEVAVRCGRDDEAERLLERCLELAPSFAPARYQYAVLLQRRNDAANALAETERLLSESPRNPGYRNLLAIILSRIGEFARSRQLYEELVQEYPTNANVWLCYGHVLKTEGLQDECIAAYRRSAALEPRSGEAYWSLANLKTFRFTDDEVAVMSAKVEDPALTDVSRLQFSFALGKAFEDARDYARSFRYYEQGNALSRSRGRHDADVNSRRTARLKATFTRDLFAARAGSGCPSPDPIFIVGMPRAGSTLLEQILSSHSAVEGTSELPEITSLARVLRGQAASDEVGAYAEVLASMDAASLRELGNSYMERTRIHRKTRRARFIDKMPNNFLHVGMIQLILPNAKIIDARRHPLACCLSNFKQHYAHGQRFAYDLVDLGRFYGDYVELMAHFDAVLPGRIHRVFYEAMVQDTETEVRRLLDYCELPFEADCLRFFENERAVRTASSEQVRQPIYREGMDHWRHYEPWLDPLKEALGPVLPAYPAVPEF
ncbi:MAG TPA: sulfotransferase [Steroidobacteraceae bacterium]|nr:sulfotransferase [Steroidobacteraceae bacterium]